MVEGCGVRYKVVECGGGLWSVVEHCGVWWYWYWYWLGGVVPALGNQTTSSQPLRTKQASHSHTSKESWPQVTREENRLTFPLLPNPREPIQFRL